MSGCMNYTLTGGYCTFNDFAICHFTYYQFHTIMPFGKFSIFQPGYIGGWSHQQTQAVAAL
jgi:hypothetical protein